MFGVEPSSFAAKLALDLYGELLAQVRADHLVAKNVTRSGSLLSIQDNCIELDQFERIFVCGAGKASGAMAGELSKILGSRLTGGLVVVKEEPAQPLLPIDVRLGAHPVPDETSIAAGEEIIRFVHGTTSSDLVIFCLSGGASSLMEAPKSGITLHDLRAVTELLLRSGADIRAVNAVRMRLSRIKGGGLGRECRARVVVLVLSDVLGNDLSVIGSGPFYASGKPDHRARAFALQNEGSLPEPVRVAVLSDDPAPSRPIEHHVIGSAALLPQLASEAAIRKGLTPYVYSDPLQGEARAMAQRITRLARAKRARGESAFCMIFAGETTVTVKGDGVGGRCQEMATLAATRFVAEPNLAFLAAGTDGSDGPTDAAGGVVDSSSVPRAKLAGASAREALSRNDSYRFLTAAGGLIKTGATGSNVNDLVLVVHAEGNG